MSQRNVVFQNIYFPKKIKIKNGSNENKENIFFLVRQGLTLLLGIFVHNKNQGLRSSKYKIYLLG